MLFSNSQENALIEWLESRSFSEVADLVNEYLDGDDYIFETIEYVADVAPSDDPLWVARALFFGNVERWGDSVRLNGYGNLESVWLNGYGNLESVWCVDQLPLDSLADAMIEAGCQSFEAVALDADGVELAVAYLADDDDQAVEMIADDLDGLGRVACIYWRLA